MNKVTRKIIFFLLRFSLIPFLVRNIVQRKYVTILYYHSIRPRTFSKHIEFLKSQYNIISLRRFIDAANSSKFVHLPPRSLIITFDDGHKDFHNLSNIIKNNKIKTTMFLVSGIINTRRHFWYEHNLDISDIIDLKKVKDEERLYFMKKYDFSDKKEYNSRQSLTKSEIESMRDFVDFQSHSHTHPILPNCSDEKSHKEIFESKRILENEFGLNIYSFAYPNGDYSPREHKLVYKAGYECGLTTDSGFNSKKTDTFRLKRTSMCSTNDLNEIIVRSSGIWEFLKLITGKRVLNCQYYN